MGPLARLSARGRTSFNDAVDWLRSTMIPQETAAPLERMKRTAELIPEAYELYDPYALMNVHSNTNLLALMDPKRFEELAYPMFDQPNRGKLLRARNLISEGVPLEDTPFLWLQPGPRVGPGERRALQTVGHEGRHRNRALAEMGLPSLVELLPSGVLGAGGPAFDRARLARAWEPLRQDLLSGDVTLLPEGYSPSHFERAQRALRTDPYFTASGWYPRPPLKAAEIFKATWKRGGGVHGDGI